jgi:hypothetical protein
VLDASERAALAACRVLGRAGHHVGVAGHRVGTLVGDSRYTADVHTLPGPGASQEAFHGRLAAVIAAHAYDVLVAVDDATLARLADRPTPLPAFPNPGRTFQRLTDKIGLAELCRDVGVAYPATAVVSDAGDIDAAIAKLGLPVVVKAARSAATTADRLAYRQGAVVAATAQAAKAAAAVLWADGLEPIVQARVPAVEKLNAAVFRRNGRSELRYAHRVLREVPITGGVGVALETIDPNTGSGREAVAILERICAAAGHIGVAHAEMYRASSDGRLYVVDVNPRLWGSTWFAERLGLRVVERGVRLALRLPQLPATPYPSGRRFHHPPGEVRWLRAQPSWRGPMVELLKTTRPWDVFDGDQISDFRPMLKYATRGLGRRLRPTEDIP